MPKGEKLEIVVTPVSSLGVRGKPMTVKLDVDEAPEEESIPLDE